MDVNLMKALKQGWNKEELKEKIDFL